MYYEILAELGRGTTGIVYKVRHKLFNRVIAVKVPVLVSEQDRAVPPEWFMRECEAMVRLGGEGIPEIFDVAVAHGQSFCSREFVDGETLAERVQSHSITPRDGLRIVGTLARTVARVHAMGLVHRNLHQSNILVGVDGVPKLIGFGRCGLLAGWNPSDPGQGTPAQIDIAALQNIMLWIYTSLSEPVPHGLDPGQPCAKITSMAELAESLDQTLRQLGTPSPLTLWQRFLRLFA